MSPSSTPNPIIFSAILALSFTLALSFSVEVDQSLTYIWPLPANFTSGNQTISIDPDLSLAGNGARFTILKQAFDRYRAIIFKHSSTSTTTSRARASVYNLFRGIRSGYDIAKLSIVVFSDNEEVGSCYFSCFVGFDYWLWSFCFWFWFWFMGL